MKRLASLALPLLAMFCGCQPSSDAPIEPQTFGRFEGEVIASWNENGRQMTLREPFTFVDSKSRVWVAPAGSIIDGASIPAAFWTLIGGPFEGKYRNASVVHDVGCVEMKQSWEDVHWMFYEACRCAGVDETNAKMLYYAVYHFGPRWESVTETIVEAQQTPDGQIVEQEVSVEHVVRKDPLPPTATELQQVAAFVTEENPEVQEIEQLNRVSLHRRNWQGKGHLNSGTSTETSVADPNVATGGEGPSVAARPNYGGGHHLSFGNGQHAYSGNRPSLPYGANRQMPMDGSRPGGYQRSGQRSGWELPALTSEEQQWAIELVRQHIVQQTGEQTPAEYQVERIRGGYRVAVQFMQSDEQGQLVPQPGGQSVVRLSRQGEIREVVSGTFATVTFSHTRHIADSGDSAGSQGDSGRWAR